jgi:hypothetical protein
MPMPAAARSARQADTIGSINAHRSSERSLGLEAARSSEMHRSAVLFLVAAAVGFPVYVLAAVHVGFTGRGRAYLALAAGAFAVQAVLNVIAQPFFGIIAMIPVAAGGIAAVPLPDAPATALNDRVPRSCTCGRTSSSSRPSSRSPRPRSRTSTASSFRRNRIRQGRSTPLKDGSSSAASWTPPFP